GGSTLGLTPENATVLHRHFSIPLSVMVREMNNESDNFFAEHVWKAASRKAIGLGSYLRGGTASALHFHQLAGVPMGEMYHMAGSGLSLHKRATLNSLFRTLIHAHKADYSEDFHRSLALAEERSGTLRRLFTRTPAADNLHAKTGYINDVR